MNTPNMNKLEKFGRIRNLFLILEILEYLPIEENFNTILKFKIMMDALKKTNSKLINLVINLKCILKSFENDCDKTMLKIKNEWRVNFFKTDLEASLFLIRLLKRKYKNLTIFEYISRRNTNIENLGLYIKYLSQNKNLKGFKFVHFGFPNETLIILKSLSQVFDFNENFETLEFNFYEDNLKDLFREILIELRNIIRKCPKLKSIKLCNIGFQQDRIRLSNRSMIDNGDNLNILSLISLNSCLETIHLENNRLGNEGIRFFSEILKINNVLKEIYLASNPISVEGGKYLAEAMKINTSLQKISLRNNTIEDDVIEEIAEILITNITNSLEIMEIEGQQFGNKGIKAISEAIKLNTTLKEISLMNNRIEDEGGKAIGEGLKFNTSLKCLNLELNNIKNEGIKEIIEALTINSHLQMVNLSWNQIGYIGAKFIKKALKNMSSVNTLNLSNNQFGDYGAKSISKGLKTNTTLETIILDNNHISIKGSKFIAEAIKTNNYLKNISLKNNLIKCQQAIVIAEALKINTCLESISLSNNLIEYGGAEAIAAALENNSSLRILHLDGNEIKRSDAEKLLELMSNKSNCELII